MAEQSVLLVWSYHRSSREKRPDDIFYRFLVFFKFVAFNEWQRSITEIEIIILQELKCEKSALESARSRRIRPFSAILDSLNFKFQAKYYAHNVSSTAENYLVAREEIK